MKNIISGQNGVFVIFNKRRNRIGKPLMRGNFENTRPSIIKSDLQINAFVQKHYVICDNLK